MESWTRRILLLRVSMHPQFYFTHQQLSQYMPLHSRLPLIETKAALRDHCKCKLSCVVPLYVLPSFNNTCVLFLEKSWPDLIIVISSQSNREAGYNLCKMQYLILACMWSEFTIWQEVFLQSLKVTQKLWQEFFRDPSQCWDHRSEKVSEHQTCLSSHVNGAIPLVGVNLFSLCGLLLSFPRLNWAEFLFRSFALVEW
jgi:hypothetical protein